MEDLIKELTEIHSMLGAILYYFKHKTNIDFDVPESIESLIKQYIQGKMAEIHGNS